KTRRNIMCRLLDVGQRRDLTSQSNALFQLTQVWLIQNVTQLGLPCQNDLQLLRGVGFEVAKQPNLLQDFSREALAFIDHQNRTQAVVVTRLEQVPQFNQQ